MADQPQNAIDVRLKVIEAALVAVIKAVPRERRHDVIREIRRQSYITLSLATPKAKTDAEVSVQEFLDAIGQGANGVF